MNGDLVTAGPLGEEVQGKPDAPITVIEYASMTCPHCASFDVNVYPVLKSRYIDTGQVRYILREFPLDPLATAGSMLARCAGDDQYFKVVDLLFRRQRDWLVQRPLAPLLNIAEQEGFTKESFDACLTNQNVLDGIETVRERAETKLGVDSTPTCIPPGDRSPIAVVASPVRRAAAATQARTNSPHRYFGFALQERDSDAVEWDGLIMTIGGAKRDRPLFSDLLFEKSGSLFWL